MYTMYHVFIPGCDFGAPTRHAVCSCLQSGPARPLTHSAGAALMPIYIPKAGDFQTQAVRAIDVSADGKVRILP
eukprot:scaffold121282_cov18-Prasinocladus_malaysianus.AAC.1